MTDHRTIASGSDVTLSVPSLEPGSPVIADLRRALEPAGWAVLVSLSSHGQPPQDVVGLLPPLGGREGPDPARIAEALAAEGPTAPLSVASFALPMAASALQVVPPISGTRLERVAVDSRRAPRAARRLLDELAGHEVLVPVDEEAVEGRAATSALDGALQVVTVDDGQGLPSLPLVERAGSAAVHAFSGVWPLLHADPPFPAVLRVPCARLAAALPDGVMLSLDVGCLHAALITPG